MDRQGLREGLLRLWVRDGASRPGPLSLPFLSAAVIPGDLLPVPSLLKCSDVTSISRVLRESRYSFGSSRPEHPGSTADGRVAAGRLLRRATPELYEKRVCLTAVALEQGPDETTIQERNDCATKRLLLPISTELALAEWSCPREENGAGSSRCRPQPATPIPW